MVRESPPSACIRTNRVSQAAVLIYATQHLVVQETKRNRGYGRALLEAIEDIARCEGLDAICLLHARQRLRDIKRAGCCTRRQAVMITLSHVHLKTWTDPGHKL